MLHGTTWPGMKMQHVTGSIYKVEVTSDMNFYLNHNYIIFNDHGNYQTYDIPLNKSTNHNQIFKLENYANTEKKRIFVQVPSTWTKLYAYMWTDGVGSNAPWPGVEITANKFSADGYFVEADNIYTMIIFNNGTSQTADLTIPAEQDMTYKIGGSFWYKYYTYGSWHNYVQPKTILPSHPHSN